MRELEEGRNSNFTFCRFLVKQYDSIDDASPREPRRVADESRDSQKVSHVGLARRQTSFEMPFKQLRRIVEVIDRHDAPIFTSLGVKIGLCYRFHVLSGAKTRRRPSRENSPPQIVSFLESHTVPRSY